MSDGTSPTGRQAGVMAPTPDVVSRAVGPTTVLVHLRTNRIYELNAQGARIWQLLGGGLSRDAIVEQLGREYDAGAERLAQDVDELLAELLREQLVHPPDD